MKAKEFDKKFDRGEDLTAHLDVSKARRPGPEPSQPTAGAPQAHAVPASGRHSPDGYGMEPKAAADAPDDSSPQKGTGPVSRCPGGR